MRQTLDANLKAGRSPSTPAELARAVGADKSGLNKMLLGDQASYKYTKQICDVLSIGKPYEENAAVSDAIIQEDEWERTVADARALSPDQQRRALRALKALVYDDESS